MSNFKLVYVNPVGQTSDGLYEYEFFLSDTPDIVWGKDWAEPCASACKNILPEQDTYSKIVQVVSDYRLNLAIENSCFSMQDCVDGVISLFWIEDDDNIYTCAFGTDYDEVKENFKDLIEIYDDEEQES